jgi:hypothetical protein
MRRSKSGQHRKSKQPSNALPLREYDGIFGRKSRGVEKEADGPRWQNATSLRPKNRCTCLVQRLRSTELVALPWPHDGTEWSRRQTPMRGNEKPSDLPCGRRRCGPVHGSYVIQTDRMQQAPAMSPIKQNGVV